MSLLTLLFTAKSKKKEQFYIHNLPNKTPPAMLIKNSGCISPAFPAFDLKWPPWWAIQGAGIPRKSLLLRPALWFLAVRVERGCDFVPSSFSSSLKKGARNERLLLLALWTNTVRRNKQSCGSLADNAHTHHQEETAHPLQEIFNRAVLINIINKLMQVHTHTHSYFTRCNRNKQTIVKGKSFLR